MIKNLFFDFDGVILDSMKFREYGFRQTLKEYPEAMVDKLLNYHHENGGLSRFAKYRYFFTEILHQKCEDSIIQELVNSFTYLMRAELVKEQYLIFDTVDFIKENYLKYNLHIVSGSEEKELKYICSEQGISDYFLSIHGSPKNKNDIVGDLLFEKSYVNKECVLIGDSINDYDAAVKNGILFYGYNNESLISLSHRYLDTYKQFPV